ncbi:phage tail tape measure protein [Bacillus thuringiensis]|nr:phage tail tape measure protein [Bacillus thuringiensis]AND10950.1 phage tail tape measure protein [Bacillus thuringiensis serovar alesti]MEC3595566.1 phage tail tape measure protein [Bacillus thuringiensis]MED1836148.1 phage tail tape measure protein [Bacillus thuringiensis]MED2668314.1 phage tail tape measure protein [Bacillus thuringiensis]OTY34672.1 phage tail tape measure protein [Bacillus thuringiensis serovar alesti]
MANAGEIKAKLILDNAQFKRGMQEAQQEMQKTTGKSKQTSEGISALNKASAAAGVAIVAAVGASVKAAANFEQSMAKVKAISGATDQEFKQLESTAKHLGATTQFSASQAAEGLSFLSLAGFKAQDSIDAIPSVLNLAAAGAIDLGTAADIASNIMTGFGLTAQDTEHATDVLAKTFTTANTDMNQLGMAMKYVAPVANALGWDIEDAATAIAKMSDAGIQGSQAGTSLRAALLSLANPTGQTEKAFEKLGISVVDANGQFKPLPELIGHISSKMEGMTDAQKTVTAAQLVGTEASAGFLALLAQGQGALQDYKTSLEESGGTAQRVAKTMQDTLIGAWTQVKSAAEGLAIQIGEALLPAFTGIANAATLVVGAMASVDPQFVAFTMTSIATTAAVAGVAVGVTKVITALKLLGAAVLGNPITAAIAVAAAGIGILTGVIATSKKETKEFHEVSLDTYREMGEKSAELSKTASRFEELQGKMKLTIGEQLRYKQLQNEIAKLEDGNQKQKLIAEWEKLGKASGLTKDEMKEYMNINDDIIAKAPATEQAFDSKGNAIAKTAEQAKKLSEEYKRMQAAELSMQEAKLMENNVKHMDNLVKSAEKAAEWKSKMPQLERDHTAAQIEVVRLSESVNQIAKEGDKGKLDMANKHLAKAKENLEEKRKEYAEGVKITQQYQKDASQLEINRGKQKEITEAKIEQQKAAVGLSEVEGDGLAAIQEKLNAQNEIINALGKAKTEQGGLNEGQQNQLEGAQKTVTELERAQGAIQTAKGENEAFNNSLDQTQDIARSLNDDLEKPTDKKVTSNIDDEKKKGDELQENLERDATKKTKGDTSDVNAKNEEADKKAQKENVKKTKGDTSDVNAKNAEADKKAQKENVKKTKGDTSDFDKKDADANQKAKKENTKKTKGDIADVEKKNAEAERQMKEEVTKNLNMDAKQAHAELDNVKQKATTPETKPVYVKVFESIQRTVNTIFGNAEKRHNGGTVHQVTKRPKFHNGGSPAGLAAHRPKFDEVDVRLLKNEMVLTQAQQAGLFNFIRTANRPTTANALSQRKGNGNQGGNVYHSTIQVAELHVREEADVERVAAELKQMERSRERAMGR